MTKNDHGWIKLHRKIKEHWIWEDPIYLKAWLTILMNCNHQNSSMLIQKEVFECKRGQSVMSVKNWANALGKGWTRQKVRHFFKLLEADNMIVTKGVRKTTILTVCNYDNYQNSQPTNNPQTTNRQPQTRKKKNDKEAPAGPELKKITDETR
jgi:DNA replication protein DnaD